MPRSKAVSNLNAPDVKREIIAKRPKTEPERIALLSGFVRSCLSLVMRGGGALELCLDCQSDSVRDYISSCMMAQFKVKPNVVKNSLIFADCEKLLRALRILEQGDGFVLGAIDESFYSQAPSYMRGVFLGCGSFSAPTAEDAQLHKSGGYHLDFSFTGEELADAVVRMLDGVSVAAHKSMRAEKYVVYVKDRNAVGDCLALIGAEKTVLKLHAAAVALSVKSDVARRLNCEIANIARTATAAVDLVDAIEYIDAKSGLNAELSGKLAEAAEARRADPAAPLSVIADRLGISKSGLKHRFDAIIAKARELGWTERDGER